MTMRRATSWFGAFAWVIGLSLTAGSAAAQTTIVSGLTLPPGATVTIEVDVSVADPLSDQVSVHRVCGQSRVLGDGFGPVTSDDPATAAAGDATCTNLPEYGDAPNDGATTFFPTASADDGAVHALGSGVFLGATADVDADGQGTAAADGDDTDGNNDDDGVVFTSAIAPGGLATVEVVAAAACGSLTCYLNAWMDFNGDGDWDDPDEQIFTDRVVAAGANPDLAFAVPASSVAHTETYCRFRLSTSTGLSTTGLAPDGEVEDYRVTTVPVELVSFEID
jgi:hypothetical protein